MASWALENGVTVQRALQTAGPADRRALAWEWTWSVPAAEGGGGGGGWRAVRKQEKPGRGWREKQTQAHVPGRSLGLTSTVHRHIWPPSPQSYVPVFLTSVSPVLTLENCTRMISVLLYSTSFFKWSFQIFRWFHGIDGSQLTVCETLFWTTEQCICICGCIVYMCVYVYTCMCIYVSYVDMCMCCIVYMYVHICVGIM